MRRRSSSVVPTLEPSDSPPSCSALTGDLQQPVASVSAARRMSSSPMRAHVGGLGRELRASAARPSAATRGRPSTLASRPGSAAGSTAGAIARARPSPRPAVLGGGRGQRQRRLGRGRRLQRLRRAAVVGHRRVPSPCGSYPRARTPLTLLTRGQSTSFPRGRGPSLWHSRRARVAGTGRRPAHGFGPGSGSDCGPAATPAVPAVPPALTGPGETPPSPKEPSVEPI